MSVHLVTFSDSQMSRSRELCESSALEHGVNAAGGYTSEGVKARAASEGNHTLSELMGQPRGCGYFAWKPYVIADYLRGGIPDDGDILVYSDVGIEFIDNVNYIIDRMDQDIFLFGNMWEHAHWCKADVAHAIMPEWGRNERLPIRLGKWYGKQAQASVIFFRVNDKTRAFVKEWLDWCLFENGRLIDDSPSRTGNHPEFREHRHDQAILTTMAYRDGIKLHWWPAQYNDGAFVYERGDYPDEGYPVIVHHHRKRNHEWSNAA